MRGRAVTSGSATTSRWAKRVRWVIQSLHDRFAFRRRARVLAGLLAGLIPPNAEVLDVGCGNGAVAHLIRQIKPAVSVRGIDVIARPDCLIECARFNGKSIPLPDSSVDVCLLVDVLHHTGNIRELLWEARRVARQHVLIKDHLCQSRLDHAVLSFMDWVGNRAYGIDLPYNYQSKVQWHHTLSGCGLRLVSWNEALQLYPFPFDRIFGRGLHFIGLCQKGGPFTPEVELEG